MTSYDVIWIEYELDHEDLLVEIQMCGQRPFFTNYGIFLKVATCRILCRILYQHSQKKVTTTSRQKLCLVEFGDTFAIFSIFRI